MHSQHPHSVSYKTLRASVDENSHAGMQLMNLRYGAREPIHVFIGLQEISSSVNMRPDSIDPTGIPFRSAITHNVLLQALLLIGVEG